MQTNRTGGSERSRRPAVAATLAGVALALALSTLTGCGAKDGASPVASKSTEPIASASTADPITQASPAHEGTGPNTGPTPASSEPKAAPVSAACRGAQALFLESAAIEDEREQPDARTFTEQKADSVAQADAALTIATGSARVDLQAVRSVLADAPADLYAGASADGYSERIDAVVPAIERLLMWAAKTCPPSTPVWACAMRNRFEPVGQAISADGNTVPADEGATAEAVIGHHAGRGVELGRTSSKVVYGWMNADHLVTYRIVVERSGGSWHRGASSECETDPAGGPEGKFEQIGGPVAEPLPGD